MKIPNNRFAAIVVASLIIFASMILLIYFFGALRSFGIIENFEPFSDTIFWGPISSLAILLPLTILSLLIARPSVRPKKMLQGIIWYGGLLAIFSFGVVIGIEMLIYYISYPNSWARRINWILPIIGAILGLFHGIGVRYLIGLRGYY